MQLKLIPLDINNQDHVDFTYIILQKRFKYDYINIEEMRLPSREQHIEYLSGNRYKYYYIINYCNLNIGIIYIIRENNEFGFFMHDKFAIKAFLQNRQYFHEIVKDIPGDNSEPEKCVFHYAQLSFKELLKLHPELPPINSKVNIKNDLSRRITEFLGFKPKTISYRYEGR